MGIKGLTSYLHDKHNQFKYDSLQNFCQQKLSSNNSASSSLSNINNEANAKSKVNLVIDGLNLVTWLASLANPATYKILVPSIYGGDFHRYTEYVESFIKVFTNHNIHLILVFGNFRWDHELLEPLQVIPTTPALLPQPEAHSIPITINQNITVPQPYVVDYWDVLEEYVEQGTAPLDLIQDPLFHNRVIPGDEERWKNMKIINDTANSIDLLPSLARARYDAISKGFDFVPRLLSDPLYQHMGQLFSKAGMDVLYADGNDDVLMSRIAKEREPCLGVWSYDTDFSLMEGIEAIVSKSARDDGLFDQVDELLYYKRNGVNLTDTYFLPCGCVIPHNEQKIESHTCRISFRLLSPNILGEIMKIPVRLLPDLAILCGSDISKNSLEAVYANKYILETGIPKFRFVDECLLFLKEKFCMCPSENESKIGYDLPVNIINNMDKCKSCSRPCHLEHYDGFSKLFNYVLNNTTPQSIDESLESIKQFVVQVIHTRYFYSQHYPTPIEMLYIWKNKLITVDNSTYNNQLMLTNYFGEARSLIQKSSLPNVSEFLVQSVVSFKQTKEFIFYPSLNPSIASILVASLLQLIDGRSLEILAKRRVLSYRVLEFTDFNPKSICMSLLLRPLRAILLGLLTTDCNQRCIDRFDPICFLHPNDQVIIYDRCTQTDRYFPMFPYKGKHISTFLNNQTEQDVNMKFLVTDFLLIKLQTSDVDIRLNYLLEAFHHALFEFNMNWFDYEDTKVLFRAHQYTYDPNRLHPSPWLSVDNQDCIYNWPISELRKSFPNNISAANNEISASSLSISAPAASLIVMTFRHLLAVISQCISNLDLSYNTDILSSTYLPTLQEIATLVAGIATLLYIHRTSPDNATESALQSPLLNQSLLNHGSLEGVCRPLRRTISLTTWYREIVCEMIKLLMNLNLMDNLGILSTASQYSSELPFLVNILCNGDQNRLPKMWQQNPSLIFRNVDNETNAANKLEISPFTNISWELLYEGRLFHSLLASLNNDGWIDNDITATARLLQLPQSITLSNNEYFNLLHPNVQNLLANYPDIQNIYTDLLRSIFSPFDTSKMFTDFRRIQETIIRSRNLLPVLDTSEIVESNSISINSSTVTDTPDIVETNNNSRSTVINSNITLDIPEDPENVMNVPKILLYRVDGERQRMPISLKHDECLTAISTSLVTAIIASTGTGKTTQLPQYILHQNNWTQALRSNNTINYYETSNTYNGISQFIWGNRECRVYTAQPEVLFATKAASRIASEVNYRMKYGMSERDDSISYQENDKRGCDKPGHLVGHIIGGHYEADKNISVPSKILLVTAGWLFAKLAGSEIPQEYIEDAADSNDNIEPVSNTLSNESDECPDPNNPLSKLQLTHLLIDEIHERKLDNEALCLLVRDLLYSDLRERFYRIGNIIANLKGSLGKIKNNSDTFEIEQFEIISRIFTIFANRPRLVVMSATFDSKQIANYYLETIRPLVESFILWLLFLIDSSEVYKKSLLLKHGYDPNILSHAGTNLDNDNSNTTNVETLIFLPLDGDGNTLLTDSLQMWKFFLPNLPNIKESELIRSFVKKLLETTASDLDLFQQFQNQSHESWSTWKKNNKGNKSNLLNKQTFKDLLFAYLSNHTVELNSLSNEKPSIIYLDNIAQEIMIKDHFTNGKPFIPPVFSSQNEYKNMFRSVQTPTKATNSSFLDPPTSSSSDVIGIISDQIRGLYYRKNVKFWETKLPIFMERMERTVQSTLSGGNYRLSITENDIEFMVKLACYVAISRCNPYLNIRTNEFKSDAILVFVSGASDISYAESTISFILKEMQKYHTIHLYMAEDVIKNQHYALPYNWDKIGENYIKNNEYMDWRQNYYTKGRNSSSGGDPVSEKVRNKLKSESKIIFVPLHSANPVHKHLEELEQIRQKPNGFFSNSTLIAFATPIAESSITIDRLHTVIDLGFHKEVDIVEESDTKELVHGWISKAAAGQRKGRVGRTKAPYGTPPTVFRFYTKNFHDYCFREHNKSGMQREIGTSAVLKIKAFAELNNRYRLQNTIDQIKFINELSKILNRARGNKIEFYDIYATPMKISHYAPNSAQSVFNRALDPPNTKLINLSTIQLYQLGILNTPNDNTANITELGYLIHRIALDPVSAMIILAGRTFNCLPDAIIMGAYNAVLTSGKSIWSHIPTRGNSITNTRWSINEIIDAHYRQLTGVTLLGKQYNGDDTPSANYVWSDHIIALRAYILWRSQLTRYGFVRDAANKLMGRFNIAVNFLILMEERIRTVTYRLLYDKVLEKRMQWTSSELSNMQYLLPNEENDWRKDHQKSKPNRGNNQWKSPTRIWPPDNMFSNDAVKLKFVLFMASHNSLSIGTIGEKQNMIDYMKTIENQIPNKQYPNQSISAAFKLNPKSMERAKKEAAVKYGSRKQIRSSNPLIHQSAPFAQDYNIQSPLHLFSHSNLATTTKREHLFSHSTSEVTSESDDDTYGAEICPLTGFGEISTAPLRNTLILDLRYAPLTWSLHPQKTLSQKAISAFQQLFCPDDLINGNRKKLICSAISGKGINSIVDEEIKLLPIVGDDDQLFGGVIGILQIRDDYNDIVDMGKKKFWSIKDPPKNYQTEYERSKGDSYDRVCDEYNIRWAHRRIRLTKECGRLLHLSSNSGTNYKQPLGHLPPLLLTSLLFECPSLLNSLKISYSNKINSIFEKDASWCINNNTMSSNNEVQSALIPVDGMITDDDDSIKDSLSDNNSILMEDENNIDNLVNNLQDTDYHNRIWDDYMCKTIPQLERYDEPVTSLQSDSKDEQDIPVPISAPWYTTWKTYRITQTADAEMIDDLFNDSLSHNSTLEMISNNDNNGSSAMPKNNHNNNISYNYRLTIEPSRPHKLYRRITPMDENDEETTLYGISTCVSTSTKEITDNIRYRQIFLNGFSIISRNNNEIVLMLRMVRIHNSSLNISNDNITCLFSLDLLTQDLTHDNILLTYANRNTSSCIITEVIFDYTNELNFLKFSDLSIPEKKWKQASNLQILYKNQLIGKNNNSTIDLWEKVSNILYE